MGFELGSDVAGFVFMFGTFTDERAARSPMLRRNPLDPLELPARDIRLPTLLRTPLDPPDLPPFNGIASPYLASCNVDNQMKLHSKLMGILTW